MKTNAPWLDSLTTLEAYRQLLAQPDPEEMPTRGHHWTQAGETKQIKTLTAHVLTWAGKKKEA